MTTVSEPRPTKATSDQRPGVPRRRLGGSQMRLSSAWAVAMNFGRLKAPRSGFVLPKLRIAYGPDADDEAGADQHRR